MLLTFFRNVRTTLAIFAIAFSVLISATFPASSRGISLIRDAEIEEMLRGYTDPILLAAGLNPKSVDIYLVNDPNINAFVAGGQNIFFHTGLITNAETPNEIKGVIAHETGHITGAHLARRKDAYAAASRPMLIGLGLSLIAFAAGEADLGSALLVGGQTIAQREVLSYTRSQEASADQAAITFLDRTKQSSRGLESFFTKFARDEAYRKGYSNKFLRTHPVSRERIANLKPRIESSPYVNVGDSPESIEALEMVKAKIIGFLDDTRSAIRIYPEEDTSDPALYARSVALYRQAEMKKAHKTLDELISRRPDNAYIQELKAQILLESGKPMEAVPFYKEAVRLKPDQAMLWMGLGRAYVNYPDDKVTAEVNKKAKAALKKVIELEKENSFAWNQLAVIYSREGNEPMASLATAERFFLQGDLQGAVKFANKAQHTLAKGTVNWNRARDILHYAVSESEARGKKRRRG